MNKKINYKELPKIAADELRRCEEESLNRLETMGFDKSQVEQLRFDQKHKLDFPSNPLHTKLTSLLSVLFNYSDRIQNDVLFDTAKGIIEINFQDIISSETDVDAIDANINQVIMEVVVEKMEMLYFFYEDEVFSSLVLDLCCILDLYPEDYGFTTDDQHENE
ncbi:MAG: hypothetical protein RBT49_11785 [Bacteroidales bacterium]|jgi:hypothetical protein|nr:hypothetical protein [Bacteroidales bacterium]